MLCIWQAVLFLSTFLTRCSLFPSFRWPRDRNWLVEGASFPIVSVMWLLRTRKRIKLFGLAFHPTFKAQQRFTQMCSLKTDPQDNMEKRPEYTWLSSRLCIKLAAALLFYSCSIYSTFWVYRISATSLQAVVNTTGSVPHYRTHKRTHWAGKQLFHQSSGTSTCSGQEQ